MIGYACCLLKPSMELYVLKQDKEPEPDRAGDRLISLMIKSEQYYGHGTKHCPKLEKVINGCHNWYRLLNQEELDNHRANPDGNLAAGHADISHEVHETLSNDPNE